MTHYKFLSESFLSKYRDLPDPFDNPMSHFTYTRTYSRFLNDKKRREFWWETVARVVEYNCSLAHTSVHEAEQLFDNIYNLKQFPSGRSLWVANTPVATKYPMSNYNCAFAVFDDFAVLHEGFYLLLVGAGMGFRVLPEDVDKLPPLRNDIAVIHKFYEGKQPRDRSQFTSLTFTGNSTTISIADTKEGWVKALDHFIRLHFDSMYREITTIQLDYDSIRPLGERLKTFGGYASGYQSMQKMLSKVNRVIKQSPNKIGNKTKLRPIDAVDLANIIGENVVSGGVRRTAEIVLFSPNDAELRDAKTELYKLESGKWVVNDDIVHRQMSNNSMTHYSKPTRERLNWQMKTMRYTGEPGIINAQQGKARRPNFEGVNACFTGDMKLLTSDGYKRFDSIIGNVELINLQGEKSLGKVWSNGIKDTVEVKLWNRQNIKCTGDHVFMLADGSECEAKDLQGKRIMPYREKKTKFNLDFVRYGFIQGDGNLSRLNSQDHLGLEVNIGNKDGDLLGLFGVERMSDKQRSFYVTGYSNSLRELGFDASTLPTREFPSTYDSWSEVDKLSFLRGCWSANGGVIVGYRLSYKVTSKSFADKLLSELQSFGIEAYITTNKEKKIMFSNGEYTCKQSYDVNICRYDSILKFDSKIGFVQSDKILKLETHILNFAPKVSSIKYNGLQEVFDFNEPIYNWGFVEGLTVHNCAEILLDSRGMCNLTEIVPIRFVNNGILDKEGLFTAQRLSARMGYRMTLVDFELDRWDYINKRDRLIGCSITGWQDFVNLLGLSETEQRELLRELREIAINAGNEIADQLGLNRPVLSTTCKPSGTISLLPAVSSGVHFSHDEFYIRRIRISAHDPLADAMIYMGFKWKAEVGQDADNPSTMVFEFPMKSPKGKTKYNVTAIEQLEIYKMFMEDYVNHNVSITVHVRDNEWDGVEQWMWDNWDSVVAISFLPLDDSFYDLLPYESITESIYDDMVAKLPKFDPTVVTLFEKGDDFEMDGSDCASGVCPIK